MPCPCIRTGHGPALGQFCIRCLIDYLLSTVSADLPGMVTLLFLNFGKLSRKFPDLKGRGQLDMTGPAEESVQQSIL